jgi:hypothetical protein
MSNEVKTQAGQAPGSTAIQRRNAEGASCHRVGNPAHFVGIAALFEVGLGL